MTKITPELLAKIEADQEYYENIIDDLDNLNMIESKISRDETEEEIKLHKK